MTHCQEFLFLVCSILCEELIGEGSGIWVEKGEVYGGREWGGSCSYL